jgi:hypothetical protein
VLVMICFAVAVMNVAEGVVRVVIIGVVALVVEVVVVIVEVLPLLPVVVVLIVLVEVVVLLVVMIFDAVLGVPVVVEWERAVVASVDVIVVVNVAIIVVAVALVLIVVAVVVDEVVVVVAEVVAVILLVTLEATSEHSGHAAQSPLINAHLVGQSWRFMAHQRSHWDESFLGVVPEHAGHLSQRSNHVHFSTQLFLFFPHQFGHSVLASAGVQIEMIIAITVNKRRCDRWFVRFIIMLQLMPLAVVALEVFLLLFVVVLCRRRVLLPGSCSF